MWQDSKRIPVHLLTQPNKEGKEMEQGREKEREEEEGKEEDREKRSGKKSLKATDLF